MVLRLRQHNIGYTCDLYEQLKKTEMQMKEKLFVLTIPIYQCW